MKLWTEAENNWWKKKKREIDHWQEVIISDVIKDDSEEVTFECMNEQEEVTTLLSGLENANAEGLDTGWNPAACLHQRLLTFLSERALLPRRSSEAVARGEGGEKQLKMQN